MPYLNMEARGEGSELQVAEDERKSILIATRAWGSALVPTASTNQRAEF